MMTSYLANISPTQLNRLIMGLQYRRRVKLGKGLGLNISNRGISASYQSKYGSVGSRGFSFRTGIPGLSLRSNWGKGGEGLVALAIIGICYIMIIFFYNLFRLLFYVGTMAISKITNNQKVRIK